MATSRTSRSPTQGSSGRPARTGAALWRRLRAAGLLAAGPNTGPPAALPARRLGGLSDDSRTVAPDGVFVAIRGEAADGHAFIGEAAAQGASLVVCETVPRDARARFPNTAFVRVTDARTACAEMAAAWHGDPAAALHLVGVTGTNGKTTVASLVHHLLGALGRPAGLLSTIEARTGDETEPMSLTTPGPIALHRLLRTMVDAGCTACTMEVSSHALAQQRVLGLSYDVAVFTNLSADHLDYHGSRRAYRAAKKRLFDGLGPDATAVYNADDEAGTAMVADTDASVVSYALDAAADVEVDVLQSRVDGLRLRINGHERDVRLAGRFNAYNLAAAYGVGRALGGEPASVLNALAAAPPVPGRFAPLRVSEDRTVVVDYAHTPDALETILRAVRATMPQEATLWCVFGCGGDRDVGKRSTMGRIAEQRADRTIVTSDNPRTEAPAAILRDIRAGVERPEAMRWIVDREEAIRAAADAAAPGDVVVIAGKGHETTQTIGTETRPFNDRALAQQYF